TYAVTATYDQLPAKITERYEGLLDRTALYQPYQPKLDDPRLPAAIKAFKG
ncbi:MAG: LLM class F420-dependent oxidoreductase, partial [Candidatus Rokubacteria bacterium]|nr:LLM class F420-dependent oxidoreductase [Candidatus Rokubacteria bacterium]